MFVVVEVEVLMFLVMLFRCRIIEVLCYCSRLSRTPNRSFRSRYLVFV